MASSGDTHTGSQSWQVGKSLSDCLRHMLDNHVACDVTFTVQSTGNPHVKIPAHKLILQARSPVFEAMLKGDSVEVDEDVVITDMDPEPFGDLLRYMYTDKVILTGENVILLLYAAKKYLLDDLVSQCKNFLAQEIAVDNVCSILTHSMIQQDEELVNTCLDFIAPNAKAVVKTESFSKMSHDALLKVVGYDHLAHGVEADLFEACIEWGKRRTEDPANATGEEIRDILGTECLHKIRFPYISSREFASRFGHSAVLTTEEKSLIYPLLATQEEFFSKELSDVGFDVASRMMRQRRFYKDRDNIYYGDASGEKNEEFTFSVNKPIVLRGFSIHGGKIGSEHEVKITVQNADTEIKCAQTTQKIVGTNSGPIPVYFSKLRITAGTSYRVSVNVIGQEKTAYSCDTRLRIEVKQLTFLSKSITNPFPSKGLSLAGYTAEFLFQILPCD